MPMPLACPANSPTKSALRAKADRAVFRAIHVVEGDAIEMASGVQPSELTILARREASSRTSMSSRSQPAASGYNFMSWRRECLWIRE